MERIREAKPPRLYIAADGPRPNRPEEKEKCAATRAVASQVDWECEVHTLFRDDNIGCGRGPEEAISWFFSHEPYGIVLEDDILPDVSYFWFCQEMLEKYADDERVWQVSGLNFIHFDKMQAEFSYHFSNCGSTWGWASWRRAWKHYDYNIPRYKEQLAQGFMDAFFYNTPETSYVMDHLQKTYEQSPDVSWWDYQWEYAKYINSGISIVPNINLIENIGFGGDATHTNDMDERYQSIRSGRMPFPLRHPDFVRTDKRADQLYFEKYYAFNSWQKIKSMVKKIVPEAVLRNG